MNQMMNQMRSLRDLYAHNAWANARTLAACCDLNRTQLEERAPGTFGTIADTIRHLVGVEDAYLRMLRDEPLEHRGSSDVYYAQDMAWFIQRSAQLSQEYGDLVARIGPDVLDQPLHVPWFDFALTKHDGLLQVLTHSAQHRAQILSVLGERGIEVPNLDYVLFVREQGGGRG
jgi:uncharacterized damage-inducible protein DinB